MRAFVDEAGRFIEHWGFKRIQGEIWAVTYLTGHPLTASEIAAQLKVSKALVSLAMRELLEYRVLLTVEGDDGRAQRLVPNEDLGEAIAGVLKRRETKLLQRTTEALEGIEALSAAELKKFDVSPGRVASIREFTLAAQQTLSALVASLTFFTVPKDKRGGE